MLFHLIHYFVPVYLKDYLDISSHIIPDIRCHFARWIGGRVDFKLKNRTRRPEEKFRFLVLYSGNIITMSEKVVQNINNLPVKVVRNINNLPV